MNVNTRTYDFMTYNVCNVHPSVITKKGASVEKYGWFARRDRVFDVVKQVMPSFVCFQEIRDYEIAGKLVRMEGDFYKNLGGHSYDFVSATNNGGGWSFRLLTAYRTDKYFKTGSYQWWNNAGNPENFGDFMDNEFGRVSLMCRFHPILDSPTKDGKSMVIKPDYDSIPVYIVNTHPGLKHQERMQHHKILIDQAHKIIKNEKALLVVAGDFNCFPDDLGDEELALYEEAGFIDVNKLFTSDGLAINGTFLGYPEYDQFVPPLGKVGAHLDRMMIKAVNMEISIKYTAKVDVNRYDGMDKPLECLVDHLVDPLTGEDLRGRFPSDHLPVHVFAEIAPAAQHPDEDGKEPE